MRTGHRTRDGAALLFVLTMRRATQVYHAGDWLADEAVGSVTLDYDDRFRRRIRLTDDSGEDFLLDLPDATLLSEGDGLVLDTGGFMHVHAADEPVADLRCATLVETATLSWHIGNRHIPVQIIDDGTLRIRDDHVIVAMAERHGAVVQRRDAPFSPEEGAYARDGAANGHGHGHSRDEAGNHGHGHGHDRSH